MSGVQDADADAPRVLVVDDNVLNVELVTFVLSAGGIDVAAATNAEQARALISTFRPALILMDIQMPGVDGVTLTQQLKADRFLQLCQVVADVGAAHFQAPRG